MLPVWVTRSAKRLRLRLELLRLGSGLASSSAVSVVTLYVHQNESILHPSQSFSRP